MILTKKAIPRRTVLRGMGATLALPLLDSMLPAFAAARETTAGAVRRLGVVYVPNGMAMGYWTPKTAGGDFALTPILEPLARLRDRVLVVSGLTPGPGGGDHAGATTKFLTGVPGKRDDGRALLAGVSMDQIAAKTLDQQTQLASLELALDGRDFAGSCNLFYSCAYTNTIAWRNASTPLPMENNPRAVFERLFGDDGTTDPGARRARIQQDKSVLDSVTERVGDLQRTLGPGDRTKLNQYLEAVRDVERRIQKTEEHSERELPVVTQPAGIPASFEEHARLMFDLQVLAYQSDLTRIITFMLGRELTGRTYPELGLPEAHHPLSHHENDPVKIAGIAKINTYHVKLFAEYLEKLRSTPDGDGSLLDRVTILYGAGMSDSNRHTPSNLPLLVAGGVRGGRHMVSKDTPVSNLHLTLLEKLGVPIESLGNSTGKLDLEPLSIG